MILGGNLGYNTLPLGDNRVTWSDNRVVSDTFNFYGGDFMLVRVNQLIDRITL